MECGGELALQETGVKDWGGLQHSLFLGTFSALPLNNVEVVLGKEKIRYMLRLINVDVIKNIFSLTVPRT
jgi:hypothetical protein